MYLEEQQGLSLIKSIGIVLIISISACTKSGREPDTFRISPEKEILIEVSTEKETATGLTYIESKEDTVLLAWQKLEENYPDQWFAYYCDNVVCHLIFPEENALKPIYAIDSLKQNRMKLFVETNGFAGEGVVRVRVFNRMIPSDADTIVYRIKVKDED